MAEIATEVSETLKTIANRNRLLILCQLVSGEKSVGELADCIGMRESSTSHNLALMRKAGIVSARRDGQTVWYSIQNPEVRSILETLYTVYCAGQDSCRASENE